MASAPLFCQSCGMPLPNEDLYGTERNGQKTDKYCTYCYQEGAFAQPGLTMQEMIEVCVPFMTENGMNEQHARELLQQQLPGLDRWKRADADSSSCSGPELEQLEAFSIAGIAATTTNETEQGPDARIPGLWQQFQQQNLHAAFGSENGPPAIYGCYSDYVDGVHGSYRVVIGCQIDADAPLPAGLTRVDIPASRYAVFTSRRGPIAEVVIELWQHIWAWTQTAPYERSFTGDFELYGHSAADPDRAIVRIYIAVAP